MTKAVQDLQTEVGRLRQSFDHRTWAAAWIAVGLVVVLAGSVGAAVSVQASNDRRIRESEQRWCPIVSLLIPRPGDPPPSTDRAKLLAERATELATEFDCPEGA